MCDTSFARWWASKTRPTLAHVGRGIGIEGDSQLPARSLIFYTGRMGKTSDHPIWIGCSGWSYADWEGPFYPEGMASGEYLEWYADRFPIVEVDSTFYRVPSKAMVKGWRERTPDGFRFVLKVPQVITHQKQLRDCEEEVDGFVTSILPLGGS